MESGIRNEMDADAARRAQSVSGSQQSGADWWFQAEQQQSAQRRQAARQEVAPPPIEAVPSPSYVAPPQDQPAQWRDDGDEQRQYDAVRWQNEMAFHSPGIDSHRFVVPPAATDVIKWPPALQVPRFAEQRRRIEAPYRRSATGLSTPTAKDYEDMIDAVGKMKATLKGATGYLTAKEYLDAGAFLDQLAAEVRARLEKAEAKK
jgi:hypothetical protein